jgi:hypothetical protein
MRPGGFDRPGVEAQIEFRHRTIGVEFHFFFSGHPIPDSPEKPETQVLQSREIRIYLC